MKPPRMGRWREGSILALSLALHALAALLVPPPQTADSPSPRLTVRLAQPSAQAPEREAASSHPQPPTAPSRRTAPSPATTPPSASRATTPISAPTHAPDHDRRDIVVAPPSHQTPTAELLNSARRIAREAGRQLAPTSERASSDEPSFFPELARALARGKLPPGVTRFADGLLKVVTPAGTCTACAHLQPSPTAAHSTPSACHPTARSPTAHQVGAGGTALEGFRRG